MNKLFIGALWYECKSTFAASSWRTSDGQLANSPLYFKPPLVTLHRSPEMIKLKHICLIGRAPVLESKLKVATLTGLLLPYPRGEIVNHRFR